MDQSRLTKLTEQDEIEAFLIQHLREDTEEDVGV